MDDRIHMQSDKHVQNYNIQENENIVRPTSNSREEDCGEQSSILSSNVLEVQV